VDYHDRIIDGEENGSRSGGSARYVPAMFVVIAAFSFVLTTAVWQLVRQTQAVEAAVHESIGGINRLNAANNTELTRLRSGLAGQTAATDALAARLASVESSNGTALERIQSLGSDMVRQWAITDQVRHELHRAATGITQARQEILERLTVNADLNASARDGMIRDVNAALTHMEQTLIAQAEEFQRQKELFDSAAERDRASRRALLNEAAQAFTVQVEGLRQILDGLRVEADAVDGGAAAGEVKATAEAGHVDSGESQVIDQCREPATASRTRESVIE